MSEQRFIGVHLTSSRIEAVSYDSSFGDFTAFHSLPLPPGVIDGEGRVLDVGALGAHFRKLWTQAGFKQRQIVLAIHSSRAVCHLLTMPRIPVSQLRQIILSEAEQFAMFRDDEVVIDYHVMSLGDDFVTVWYAAASRSVLEGYQHAVRLAGLSLRGLDLAQVAGLRGMAHYLGEGETSWASFQLDATKAQYSQWQDGKLLVLRELSLPRSKDAEIELLVEYLLSEIERMRSASETMEVPPIMISADSLAASQRIATEVSMASDWAISVPGGELWAERLSLAGLDSVSHPAIGIGLWGLDDNVPSFDLLKNLSKNSLDAARISVRNALQGRDLPIAAAIVLTVGILQASVSYVALGNIHANAAVLRTNIQTLAAERDQFRQEAATHPLPEENLLAEWLPLRDENQFVYGLLGLARNLTPSTAWLKAFTYGSSSATESGVVLEGGTTEQAAALYLANQLSSLEEVRFVQLRRIILEGNAYAFSIRIGLQKNKKRELL